MSKARKRPGDDFDEVDLFYDDDLDLEAFIDSMEAESVRRAVRKSRRRGRASWQMVDDLRDARLLREQLQDWEDWNENDELG